MFFSATITLEDGTELTEEQLIHNLDQDLVSYSFGSCNGYPELFCLSMTADVSKYEAAIQWIRRLLWSSKNTTNKLQNRIAIIKQAIPEYLRDPQSTMAEVEADELYTDRYTSRASNNRRLMQWLPGFERQLKRDGPGVVKELESIRATCAYSCCIFSP
jgi:Zn-dependent M16 (insulinase) family peptidase